MDKKLRGQHMGQIVSMNDEVTMEDNSRSGMTKRMNKVLKFPGNESK